MEKKNNLKQGQKQRTVFTSKIVEEMIADMNRGIVYEDNPFFNGDINYKAANILFQLTPEEKDEYVKCSADPVYFIENYVPFENDHGITLVKLRDYQVDFIHLLADEYWDSEYEEFIPTYRNVISMQSRQNAKTTTMAAVFIWYAIFHNERHGAIVANKGETMYEIFRKMDNMLKNMPFWIKPGIVAKNMSGISFDNGTFYKGFNCSKTPSIGFTTHLLYIDEAALIAPNIMNEFWTAIYPTLSSSKLSKIVLTSTPRGRQNKFYELWDKGERGLNSFKTFRVDWWQNPDHDEAWAEQQRKDFGEIEFAQEFELQWDVAASKVVRGTDMQFMKRIKKIYVNKDIDTIPEDVCKKLWWDPDFDPTAVVRKRQKIFINIDTAEGKELTVQGKSKADYNIMQIYVMELMSPIKVLKFALDKKIKWSDIFRFRQVGVYIDNNNDEEAMAKAAKYLVYGTFKCGKTKSQGVIQRGMSMLGLGGDNTEVKSIDNVRILLEMNFNGKNFLNLFKDSDWWYDSIVLKTYHQKPVPGVKQKKKFGYKTTSGGNGIGKSYFCEEGAKMLTKRQIIVNHWNPDDPNECTISELGAFDKIKKSTVSKFYQYEGVGLHDDLAKTVLDCSRAVEIEEFVLWLQEYFESEEKIREGEGAWKYPLFQRLMNISVDTDEGELTDDEFVAMYTDGGATAGNTFARMNARFPTVNGNNGIVPGSTYGSMMHRNATVNPYLNRQSAGNPYVNRGSSNPYNKTARIPGGIEGFGKF